MPPVGSQMRPLGHIFHPKGPQSGVSPTAGTLLKPTWARPAAQNAQDCVFIDSGVVLGVVVGLILERFGFDFGAITGKDNHVTNKRSTKKIQHYSVAVLGKRGGMRVSD